MARTVVARHRHRRADDRARRSLFSAVLCAAGSALLWFAVNPLTMWLTLRHLHRLCRRLHRAAQAADAAEHRHRRRLGGDAAGARLGGDPRRGRARGADPLPDHLPLDAAALLGARALPRRGLPPRRPADAAGDARRRVHAPARLPLHAGAVRGDAAALRLRHERADLPRRGDRPRRRCSAATAGASGAATPTRWRGSTFRFSIVHLSLLFAALLVDHYLWPLFA